jgi:hypothetical protein
MNGMDSGFARQTHVLIEFQNVPICRQFAGTGFQPRSDTTACNSAGRIRTPLDSFEFHLGVGYMGYLKGLFQISFGGIFWGIDTSH